jgi:signal transduction histidine kinase
MTDKPTVSDAEIANMRHNMNLLRSQIRSGQVDGKFLTKQVDNLVTLLEHIDAERKQQKNVARFEALYNVSRVLGSSLDLQTVLNQVMDAIIQLTRAERGFLMLRDDDGGLTIQAARNFDQQTLLGGDDSRYSRTIANQVLDSGKPIVTTNAAEDPRFSGQMSIITQSLRSIMATPLRARGTVIGVVYVDNRALTGLFSEDDLNALDAFAGQAGIAIENARLFAVTDQKLEARVNELTQLRRIDLLLNETLDADRAMLYTLEWACRLANADGGHLGLLEGDPPRIHTAHSYGTAAQGEKPVYLDGIYPELLDVVATGKAISKVNNGIALIMAPFKREQKVIGTVVLTRSTTNNFTDDERDLVERVVARASVAIENARLYAAVQAADRAKSEFVGIVAHDLKAPMTSILGYADLAQMQGGLSERQDEFMTKIHNTVKRMEMLVSDLADISRIESGHFYMDETRVTVDDIVQAVKDNTMPQLEARKHKWVEQIEAGLPALYVDYYRLLQVLTNLVSNAIKYTPEGGAITLTVKHLPTQQRVQFSVTDTGIGLSKEGVLMLGTKFWRAEDDFTRSQPGTGLGFAITRSLIEQMGSHVQIDSEVGKGSTFTFSVATAKDAS